MRHSQKIDIWQLLVLFFSIYTLFSLVALLTGKLSEDMKTLLHTVDVFVCIVFFVDFLRLFWKAENRTFYFFSWGWIDLLSSIPTLDALRWGRLLRLVRIFRGIRSMKVVVQFILHHRKQSNLAMTTMITFSLIILSAMGILIVEQGQGNIKGGGDALWWAMTTITTVGYGDLYPSTIEGRVIAALLMCAGVGIFGSLTAILASSFIDREQQAEEKREKIREKRLEKKIDFLSEKILSLEQRLRDAENSRAPQKQIDDKTC